MVDLTLKTFISILILFFAVSMVHAQNSAVTISKFDVRSDQNGIFLFNPNSNGTASIKIDNKDKEVEFVNNIARLDIKPDRKGELLKTLTSHGYQKYLDKVIEVTGEVSQVEENTIVLNE